MKVSKDRSVDAAVRTLDEADRRKVFSWFTHLANWGTDPHVRKISRPTTDEGVYALNTTDDLRIFFRLDLPNDEITILDIAKPSRFKSVSATSG